MKVPEAPGPRPRVRRSAPAGNGGAVANPAPSFTADWSIRRDLDLLSILPRRDMLEVRYGSMPNASVGSVMRLAGEVLESTKRKYAYPETIWAEL